MEGERRRAAVEKLLRVRAQAEPVRRVRMRSPLPAGFDPFQDDLAQWISLRVSRRMRYALRVLEQRKSMPGKKFCVSRWLRRQLVKKLRQERLFTRDEVEAPEARLAAADRLRQGKLFPDE